MSQYLSIVVSDWFDVSIRRIRWQCWGSGGIDDEAAFATKFIYNNGNNAPTDNITAWVAA